MSPLVHILALVEAWDTGMLMLMVLVDETVTVVSSLPCLRRATRRMKKPSMARPRMVVRKSMVLLWPLKLGLNWVLIAWAVPINVG